MRSNLGTIFLRNTGESQYGNGLQEQESFGVRSFIRLFSEMARKAGTQTYVRSQLLTHRFSPLALNNPS